MTLTQLKTKMEAAFNKVSFIGTFKMGDINELNDKQSKYAVVNADLEGSTLQDGYLNHTIVIHAFDRLDAKAPNEWSCWDVAISAIELGLNHLRADNKGDIFIVDGNLFTPFTHRFSDDCAGVYTRVNIRVKNHNGRCTE